MISKVDQSLDFNSFKNSASSISSDPYDRIPANVRDDVLNQSNLDSYDKIFFDVHAHSFTTKHVPDNFRKILSWVSRNIKNKLTKWLAENFDLPFNSNRSVEVMGALVDYYDNFFMDQFISPHLFIVNLMMDMERGIPGGVESNYEKQLRELTHMMTLDHRPDYVGSSQRTFKYNETILPFLAVDPHNPDIFRQFISAFSPNVNLTSNSFFDDTLFFGVKIYPTLGYMPYDPTLMKIFEVCAEKKIPVTTHCGGIRTRANKFSFELGDFRKPEDNQYVERTLRSKEEFKNWFVYPKHWEPVLNELPDLKLNIAHMADGDDLQLFLKDRRLRNMFHQTMDLLEIYPNVYSDISYSFYDDKVQKLILSMMKTDRYRSKILYGSDYFLIDLEKGNLGGFIRKLKDTFKRDDALWHELTVTNPVKFLFD